MSDDMTTYPTSKWECKSKPVLLRPYMILGFDDILKDTAPKSEFGISY
jgi:hypothetical protein